MSSTTRRKLFRWQKTGEKIGWVGSQLGRRYSGIVPFYYIGCIVFFVCLSLTVFGCPKNIGQHTHSGKDYLSKDANPLELENGEGSARDIVTYPGGDRVDWRVISLPKGQVGTLRLRVKWRPARPGMDIAFNVYDEYFANVAKAKPGNARRRNKKASVRNASGKYYLQVYAPKRSDAAEYLVDVRFDRGNSAGTKQLIAKIADPPNLPMVPKANTQPGAQGGNGTMPGAGQPGQGQNGSQGNGQNGGMGNDGQQGNGEVVAKGPLLARVINVQVAHNGGVIVKMSRGRSSGVRVGWKGSVLSGRTRKRVEGGSFTVIRVTRNESVAKIKLSVDQIKQNRRVLLSP